MPHELLSNRLPAMQPPPAVSSLAPALIGGMLFALLAFVSMELTRAGGAIAVVWLPNAVAIATLLRLRPTREGMFYAMLGLGSFAANILQDFAFAKAGGLAVANIVEIYVAVSLVRRWVSVRPDMRSLDDLLRVGLAVGVVAPLASSMIAVPVLVSDGAPAHEMFLNWALTDAIANLIIAPAMLIVWDAWSSREPIGRRSAVEWTLITAFGLAVTAAVFFQSKFPFLFFVPIVIVVQAFRLGSLGTAALGIGIAAIALVATAQGVGPVNLANATFSTKLFVLQTFLVSCFAIGLPIAALLNRRADMMHELDMQREELKLLTDNITDAVLQYDLHGLCIYASPSVADVLGRPPSEFIGYTASERLHPQAKETVEQVERQLVSGEIDKTRLTYRRLLDDADGRPVHIEADCAVARNPETGEREGILVSARDVSERVRLEQQLVRARRHAEQAALAKSQFLANMSHEIRTPMNGVLGFADLLRSSDLPPEAAHQARMIAQSGRSMMQILNDILDLSKIEAGEMELSLESVLLGDLVHDCIELQSGVAQSKGLAIDCTIDENLPDAVVGDPLRLQQMLLNLIGNAVKFTETGMVMVAVQCCDGRLCITVTDTGIGISAKRMKVVLDPFVQAEADTSRRYGGSGLGLSITRQLAEMMGGTLSLESVLGEGSTFTLDLPLVAADRRRDDAIPPTSRRVPAFAETARILVAEDHDVNRMLIGAMLERCGLRADFADGGNAAIERVVAASDAGRAYDLVLMDIQMPDCDGYEATRAIRLAGYSADLLPIVALTANAYADDIENAKQAGMQAHLAKPLTFEHLVEALVRWLPHRILEDTDAAELPPTLPPAGAAPSVEDRWEARRQEGLTALREAMASGLEDDEARRALARQMHKLAGTAGMFGEEALGEAAGELERALLGEKPACLLTSGSALLALAADGPDPQRKTAAP